MRSLKRFHQLSLHTLGWKYRNFVNFLKLLLYLWVCLQKWNAAVYVHRQPWCDNWTTCDLQSPVTEDDGHISLSDWSGSDVRRRLHGGCCLATHLSNHCQLPSVPPTQTLALWITLHEHAQRRESALWMCDTQHSIHSSVLFIARCLCATCFCARAETIELGD